MKICTICNIKKELTEFYRSKYMKDGRASQCKKCDNTRKYELKRRISKEKGAKEKISTLLARELFIKNLKRCPSCKEIKPLTAFYTCGNHNNGYASYCIICSTTIKRNRPKAERQTAYQKYKKTIRNENLIKKFGITLDEYNRMLTSQGGVCKICGKVEKTNKDLAVDHCHNTNKIRGLLCSSCNIGIGCFKESINTLKIAIKYLENHQEGG